MKKATSMAQVLFVGASVHSVVGTKLDPEFKAAKEEDRICVEPKIYTTSTITVNSVQKSLVLGGVEALVINGGKKSNPLQGAEVPFNEQPVMEITQFDAAREEGAPQFTPDYGLAADVANLSNQSELQRMHKIRNKVNDYISALETAIRANNDAKKLYPND